MTNDEIKAFIAEKTAEGVSLSKIQDALLAEKQVRMTYMELRMLASEIENEHWKQVDKAKEPPKPEEPAQESLDDGMDDDVAPGEAVEDAPAQGTGKTVVEVSKLVKPGTAINGSVQFASGASADWFVDQTGQLGFSSATGKPTREDLMEFQKELQKMFGGN